MISGPMKGGRTAMVVKQFEFAAGHRLPNHDGLCKHWHGHNYKLEVGIRGPIREKDGSSSEGMVIDFKDVKVAVKEGVLRNLDHQNLNEDRFQYDLPVTTAENIAWHIYNVLLDLIEPELRIEFVRVWETSTSYATVSYWDLFDIQNRRMTDGGDR